MQCVFDYYPKFSAIKYSFFEWDGQQTENFVGLKNFRDIFTRDSLFFATCRLVGILLVANLFKMWPSIFTAIVLHRIRSERWQYVYRVLFVLPMVIPGLVWLLVWKSFFDPSVGILNRFLSAVGMIHVLQWLDIAMPKLASALMPLRTFGTDPIGGSVWGWLLLGAMILTMLGGLRGFLMPLVWWAILISVRSWIVGADARGCDGDAGHCDR